MVIRIVGRDSLNAGLIIALRREAVGLDRDRLATLGCMIEIRGPGADAARAAAGRLLRRGARLLLSWGTAGALTDLAPGTLLLPTAVRDESGNELPLDDVTGANLAGHFEAIAPARREVLLSATRPVTSVEDKRALRRTSGALAVDMETHAIASEAASAGATVVAVRVIVDTADMVVPPAAVAALDGPTPRIGRLLANLLRRPGQTSALIHLARASRQADTVLRACARALPEALYEMQSKSINE